MKLSQWKFKMQLIGFVRFIILLESIEIEPDTVHTIAELPATACNRNFQVFLSFTNFYRYFVSSFLHLAKLMTDMIKGGKPVTF